MSIDFNAGIARFGGRRERYLHYLSDAISSIPAAVIQIRAEVENQNLLEAERLAHALRGRVGTLGMTGMSDRLLDLEIAIRSRSNIDACFALADIEYGKVKSDAAVFAEGNVLIEWKEDYSVGVPELDKQHQELFGLVGQLAAKTDASSTSIHELLAKLADYAFAHFETEEGFLQTRGCSNLADHIEEHTRFISQVTSTSLNAMSGHFDQAQLLDFLHTWLVNHIIGIDQPQLRRCLGQA